MTDPRQYTGLLRKGPDDTVTATITDGFGFSIIITGTRCAGGYALVGVRGPIPEEYRIEGLDDPVGAT